MSAALHLPSPRRVPVTALAAGVTPRLSGERAEHIEALATAQNPLAAILVHRPSIRDGMHRLKATVLIGQESIEVLFVDGPEPRALLLAVSGNVAHGLPMGRPDREAAAARIIEPCPQYSDRRIAGSVAFSRGAVGRVRRRAGPLSGLPGRLDCDGRSRPVDWAAGRHVASAALARNTQASLRAVARIVGISHATGGMSRTGRDAGMTRYPVLRGGAASGRRTHRGSAPDRTSATGQRYCKNGAGTQLCASPNRGVASSAGSAPQAPTGGRNSSEGRHRTGPSVIAELARSCAHEWMAFAEAVERG